MNNNWNLINSCYFVEKVKDLMIEPHYKLISFDIVNLYTNVPVSETLRLLRTNLVNTNKLDANCINEILELLGVILDQNYFCLLYTSRCV